MVMLMACHLAIGGCKGASAHVQLCLLLAEAALSH